MKETSKNTFNDRLARTIPSAWLPRTSTTLLQRHRHQHLWHHLRWHHQHYRMALPTPHRPVCQKPVKSTLPCQVDHPKCWFIIVKQSFNEFLLLCSSARLACFSSSMWIFKGVLDNLGGQEQRNNYLVLQCSNALDLKEYGTAFVVCFVTYLLFLALRCVEYFTVLFQHIQLLTGGTALATYAKMHQS